MRCPTGRHEINVWCGFGADHERARAHVAPAMEALYATPFERFDRYVTPRPPRAGGRVPRGDLDSGCRSFNLIAANPDADEAVAGVAEVRRLLRGAVWPAPPDGRMVV